MGREFNGILMVQYYFCFFSKVIIKKDFGTFRIKCNFAVAMSKLFKNNDSENTNSLFESWSLSKINYILFGIGLTLIILGYILMGKGEVYSFQSLTLAPIMLFIGYIIVIPASLIYRDKSSLEAEE